MFSNSLLFFEPCKIKAGSETCSHVMVCTSAGKASQLNLLKTFNSRRSQPHLFLNTAQQ